MSYMRDWRGRRLDSFDPARDVPGVYAWFDASSLTGTDGSNVLVCPDVSGSGNDVSQFTAGAAPTLAAASLNGHNTLRFQAGQFLSRPTFGGSFPGPNTYPQPLTYIALCKFNSSLSPSASRGIMGGISGVVSLFAASPYGQVGIAAGTNGATGGPNLVDGNWHIVAGMFDTNSGAVYVDGYLVGAASTQTHGTNAMAGLYLGSYAGGNRMADGWIAEAGVTGRLSGRRISSVTSALATKWGL